MSVAPFAGAWIEIHPILGSPLISQVAPFAGAWIEIQSMIVVGRSKASLRSPERGLKLSICASLRCVQKSLRSPERGLKYIYSNRYCQSSHVAPFAGAWIEIPKVREVIKRRDVAPFAGAWIEISDIFLILSALLVAPFAGAWIEIR